MDESLTGLEVLGGPEHFSTAHLVTETEEPLDNLFCEKQMRLLTEPLWTSWKPGRSFWVSANVGMYEALNAKAVVPDVMLSLDVQPADALAGGSKCYFFWDHGKGPEVVIEIVSNKVGAELGAKMQRYAKLRVPTYAVMDPDHLLSDQILRVFDFSQTAYHPQPPAPVQATAAGLGLRLWEGSYEDTTTTWLRWVDEEGHLVLTGKELAEREAARASREAARAERLADKLRELGVDPDAIG
jgi:Uma2 family endonuclease